MSKPTLTSFPRTRKYMRENHGLILTDEQVAKFARRDSLTRRDVLKYDCTDTIVRDHMLGVVVQAVLGKGYDWPCNGNDPEWTNLFYDCFFNAADAKGIKVEPRVLKNAKSGAYKIAAMEYREATRFKYPTEVQK